MTLIQYPSPNYQQGREHNTPTDIVLHEMDGTLADCDAQFGNPLTQVSAHYGIEDVIEHQYVQPYDTAWHAGTHKENLVSIGIEHSATPTRPASLATINTSIHRIVTLIKAIPTLSADRIYPHHKFVPTYCPGTLPIEYMIAHVKLLLVDHSAYKEVDMILLTDGNAVFLTNGQTKRHIGPAEVADWQRVLNQDAIPRVNPATIIAMHDAP